MNNDTANNPDRPFRVVGLPGDGVGAEVYESARQVLAVMDELFNLPIELDEQLIGGVAVDATGSPLPQATIDACKSADAALMGAVGGPKWDNHPAEQRPEAGLLKIRSEFNLLAFSPLRPERLVGVDLLMVRELTGGIYFGKKWRDADQAEDVCRYTRSEIERITRAAGRLARQRKSRITLVDKANILETSRLWREVVSQVLEDEFPDLSLETLLVDAAAMHLLTRPADFDVMLTENLFGDILSDEASMLCGSMGLLPSASLNDERFGLYEPIHGSAPQGKANPYAMLLSVAMMLRHSLDRPDEADALESSIHQCWDEGILTPDLVPGGCGTARVTEAVCERLSSSKNTAR